MQIPWQELAPETLRALAEEFVSREGTDYGAREATFETKVEAVLAGLRDRRAVIVFDAETESCDIRENPARPR